MKKLEVPPLPKLKQLNASNTELQWPRLPEYTFPTPMDLHIEFEIQIDRYKAITELNKALINELKIIHLKKDDDPEIIDAHDKMIVAKSAQEIYMSLDGILCKVCSIKNK